MQHTPTDLKAAIDTMFRIRAVESPPDEQGARTVWHRGAKGADLISTVDAKGQVSRQELFLFEHYYLWDRSEGLRTGASPPGQGGLAPEQDIFFDQDQGQRMQRLGHAAQAFAGYAGVDQLIEHARVVLTQAANGDPFVASGAVTAPVDAVKLADLKEASQELLARELKARLRRRMWWLLAAAALAAGAGLAWWVVQ